MKIRITVLILFLMMQLIGKASFTLDNSDFEKYVQEGTRQYKALLEFNRKNMEEGCPEHNWYIFSFNPDDNWMEWSNGGVDVMGNQLYNPVNLQQINDEKLVQFNQNGGLDEQLYVCVVTDWIIPVKAWHPEDLINNQNTTIPTKDLLLEFSTDDKKVFKEQVQGKFYAILEAILNNTHQDNGHSQFTKANKTVWGVTEFRAEYFFGQEKLTGGVFSFWKSDPSDMNQFVDKAELYEYINFVKAHRSYETLNSRETRLKHNIEGFTEFLTGTIDQAYVPMAEQLQFEDLHFIPWNTIPDYLKSTGGGNAAYNAAVTLASDEISQKVSQNEGIDPLSETADYKHVVNGATTSFGGLSSEKLLQLDDKFAYLDYKNGPQFYVYFKHVNFLMPPDQYNVFANEVFIESGLNNVPEGAVLICIPYFNPGEDILNVNGLNLTGVPSSMPGIAHSANLMGPDFITEANEVLQEGYKIWEFLKTGFKHTPKPHRVHSATLMLGDYRDQDHAARLFVEDLTPEGESELVTGFLNMNELFLYVDDRIETLRELEEEKLTECVQETNLSGAQFEACDDLALQIEALFDSELSGFTKVNYGFNIKEKYLDPEIETLWKGGEYLAKYAILELDNNDRWFDNWWTEFDPLEDDGIIYNTEAIQLVYEALDVFSLVPAIGELADGVILIVGVVDWTTGGDPERAAVAVGTSSLGIFMIGENYVEIPLKNGKKLFVGPSIGFVTKETIGAGTDPLQVKKIFGLPDAGPGSTANKLVSTQVEDGRYLHQIILNNDKLFDHIRILPYQEKFALLFELSNNPNLLRDVFDSPSLIMKPVDYWRKIYNLPAMAKQAVRNLNEADKVVFYNHIDEYGSILLDFAGRQSDEIDAIGCWKNIKEGIADLGINETGIAKTQTLLGDLKDYPLLITGFKDRPAFVQAWDVLYGQGDEALLAMRTNADNLDIVEEYIYEYPESLSDLQVDYILAGNKQGYVNELLGPGQIGGPYVKHRVRNLYTEISQVDDLGVITDAPSGYTGIVSHVEPEIGGFSGTFVRQYEPENNLFIFKAGFLHDAPSWLDNGQTPLVQGKGIPTQMLVTLRQMKLLNIPEGSLVKGKMDMIQNARTMLEVTRKILDNNWTDFDQFGNEVLEISSVNYAVSTLKQGGYRITNAGLGNNNNVQIITAQQALIDFQITEMTQDLLDEYGFNWNSEIFVNFDILFDLQAF
jgi:hypothetical protein